MRSFFGAEEQQNGVVVSEKAAELIGYAAIKYFDLKQHRMTDYKFSFDRMLDPRGE